MGYQCLSIAASWLKRKGIWQRRYFMFIMLYKEFLKNFKIDLPRCQQVWLDLPWYGFCYSLDCAELNQFWRCYKKGCLSWNRRWYTCAITGSITETLFGECVSSIFVLPFTYTNIRKYAVMDLHTFFSTLPRCCTKYQQKCCVILIPRSVKYLLRGTTYITQTKRHLIEWSVFYYFLAHNVTWKH